MAFAITDGKTTLYTDFPYESGAFGYMVYDFAAVPKAAPAVCLITHGHRDHFDPALFSRMDAKVIAPPRFAATLPAGRVIPFAPRIVFRDITVQPFKTPHGSSEHFSYLVTWHGRRLYLTGDTDSTDQLLALKGLDCAFVSPWLLEACARKNARIDARRVIVYHHRADETVAAYPGALVPRQGQTVSIEGRIASGS